MVLVSVIGFWISFGSRISVFGFLGVVAVLVLLKPSDSTIQQFNDSRLTHGTLRAYLAGQRRSAGPGFLHQPQQRMKSQQNANHSKGKNHSKHTGGADAPGTATRETARRATAMLEEGTRTVEDAVKTGMRLQQDAANWWMHMFLPASPGEISRQPAEAARQTILQTQKSVGLWFNLVEQNTRTGTELLQKTVDAMQAKTIPEAQTKVLGLWESAFSAIIEATRAITSANSKAIESWMSLLQGRPEASATNAR